MVWVVVTGGSNMPPCLLGVTLCRIPVSPALVLRYADSAECYTRVNLVCLSLVFV